MSKIKENINKIKSNIPKNVTLVAVSKTYPNSAILEAYEAGQKAFGENKVQELVTKYETLPKDIEWHMIGHLQTNKVKYIAPFVHLIHGIDSLKLLTEVNKRAQSNQRNINVLLQIHIAKEETKFGFSEEEVISLFQSNELTKLTNIAVVGLMGMATNTPNEEQIRNEFKGLKSLFQKLSTLNSKLTILSMGMSSDYKIAIEEGSTMIRVGSSIFGKRNYN
ncbi:MAG: YggS family pyridoxal phosphate-dependent enzyme [Flavobacteriales bacterium]|nr:YggS family pyridoxal phosphate-dependent enzyme [Flavobacteriales bacterium]